MITHPDTTVRVPPADLRPAIGLQDFAHTATGRRRR